MDNREIKFKAWDTQDRVMVSPEMTEVLMGLEGWKSHRFIWLQFTGLHDVNGKEIYNKDILSVNGRMGIFEYNEISQHPLIRFVDRPEIAYELYGFRNAIEVLSSSLEHPELSEIPFKEPDANPVKGLNMSVFPIKKDTNYAPDNHPL